MRAIPLAAACLLALAVLAPGATAGPTTPPPPVCIICVIVTQIVLPCVVAEAQQDVLGSGDGCAIVNAQQQCVADEAEQDAFDQGTGCGTVNGEQWNVDCQLWRVEVLLGLPAPCAPPS